MLSSGSEAATTSTTTTRRRRTINLFNPSSSPATQVPYAVDSDDQKIDFASIAGIFGLVPATLKLNGYFIASGRDFVSSSVTWKSLLSFFSSRRLPTGEDRAHAVAVDGKFCRAGTKRSYEPQAQDTENHSCSMSGVNRMPLQEVMNSIKRKRSSKSNTGCRHSDVQVSQRDGASLKRKYLLEGINNQLKKSKESASLKRKYLSGDMNNQLKKLKESASLKRKYMSEDINNQLKKLKVNETELALSPKIQEINLYAPRIQELNFHAVT